MDLLYSETASRGGGGVFHGTDDCRTWSSSNSRTYFPHSPDRQRPRQIFDNNLTSTSQNRRLIGSLRATPSPWSQTIPAIVVNDVLLSRTDHVAKRFATPFSSTSQSRSHSARRRSRALHWRSTRATPGRSQPLISLGSRELVVLQRGRRLYIIKQLRVDVFFYRTWDGPSLVRCKIDTVIFY